MDSDERGPSGHEGVDDQPAADGSGTEAAPDATNTRRWPLIAGLVAFAVVVAAVRVSLTGSWGDPLGEIAADTCERLEGAIVLQVAGILEGAIADAEGAGATGPELGDRLRSECPALMAAALSDGQQAAGDVQVVDVTCGAEEVVGLIENNGDQAVDVWLDVFFYDRNDVLLDTGLANVRGLAPGQRGRYSAWVLVDGGYARCRAAVSRVSNP